MADPDAEPAALAAADVFLLTIDPVDPPTRAAVAAALAGRTPLRLARACWGFAVQPDGRVRVAIAHRDRVLALAADRVTGAGVLLWERPARRPVSPWWLLAAIPLLTGLGAWGLTLAGEARLARARPAAVAQARTRAEADAVRAVIARVPVSTVLARIEARLPADATLHAIGVDGTGTIALLIDSPDPATLPPAFAPDPELAGLRTVEQQAVADRGMRTRMRGTAR